MMSETVERLKRVYNCHKTLKNHRLTQWQEIAEYYQPERANFFGAYTKADDREKLFDSTPEDAAETLAADLHANCTSSVHDWFHLGLVGDNEADDQEEKDWLEAVTKIMLAKFNDGETGFHSAMHEFYLDFPVFGVAGLFIENPAPGKVRFICEPPSNYVLSENADGRPDTFFREFEWDARKIYEKWPKSCSSEIKKAYDEKEYTRKFRIIHAMEPRSKYSDIPGKKKIAGKDMPIASIYFEEATGKLLDESGFQEQAFFSPRWAKVANDPYGRGIAQKTMPDVRVLNEIKRSALIAAEKQADPTTLLPHDGFIGNWDSSGGALNFHRGTGDIREKVMTIGSDADLNVFQLMATESQNAIRKMFLNDKIVPMSKQMTATEYVGTFEQNQKVLGPTYGRLQTEFFDGVIQRMFGIMLRDGELPPPPESLQGQKIKIKYISPITRSQKQIEAKAFSDAFNYLAPVGQIMPRIGQAMERHLDADFLVRNTQQMFGYPAKNLKSLERIKKEDQAAAEAQQQQQDMAMKAQELELAGKANEVRNSGQSIQE